MKLIQLVFVSTFMMFASTVYAEPADVVMIDETIVICFDGNGDIALANVRLHQVTTNSDTGEVHYTIHGTCDGALPEGAVHFENGHLGFICAPDAPFFKYVMTPKGNMKYKCQNFPFD